MKRKTLSLVSPLNRPEAINAIDRTMFLEIGQALEGASRMGPFSFDIFTKLMLKRERR